MAKRLMRRSEIIRTDVTLEKGFQSFIKECEVKNLAEDTIKTYQRGWNSFIEFLSLEFEEVEFTHEVAREMTVEYVVYKREKKPNISDATINNELRSIRAVLYYFMDNELTKDFRISQVKERLEEKEVYNEEEQIKLLERPKKKASFSEYRNWVILVHLFSTGNRTKAVREMKIKHICLTRRIMLLENTKNNDSYEMPINSFYFPILKEYLNERLSQGAVAEDYLFCNHIGEQFTADGLRTSLYKYHKRRGVEKTSLHLIRHTFATTWIIEGGSPKKLQKALGQKSSVIVDKYIHLVGRDLVDDFEEFTPIGKLKGTISGKKKLSRK